MKRASKGACVALAAVIGSISVSAQTLVSVLPEEPPTSLFSGKLGDADVEAFAQGFWEASISTSGSWSIGSDQSGFNAVPFMFAQTPDLYAFLKYRLKWVFEAYVTETAGDSLFSLSYEGDESDFIKDARLGNARITFPDYPYMSFGDPAGSFGVAVSARDESRALSFDAMARWDGLAWKSRDFYGSAEAVETEVAPSDQLRGRRFVLPDPGIVSLTLIDESSGTARTLASDEFAVNLADAVILLDAEPRGALRVTYVTSGGVEKSLALYELGTDDDGETTRTSYGHEARNAYAMPGASASGDLFVRSLATGQPDSRFAVKSIAAGIVEVYRAGSEPGDEGFMSPFLDDTPWIYDDDGDGYPAGDGFSIIRRVVQSVDAITLDEGAVAGTISVYRDGTASSSFSYDDDSKTLSLNPPPRAGETLQVRYAVESQDRSDGALAFAAGTRWPWLGLSWSAAIGGRVPLFGLGYDEEGELKSSWAGASIGAAAEWEWGSFEASATARYQKAGAAGVYRVAGMEESVTLDDLSVSWIPAMRPVEGDAAHLSASSTIDSELAASSEFSGAIATVHPTGNANRVLTVEAETGATGDRTRFIRHIEAAPLSSFDRLSFFARSDGVSAGSIITLRVGDGEGEGASIEIPLEAIDGEWAFVTLTLDPAAPAVSAIGPDGASVALPGADGSFSIPGNAGLLELEIYGLYEGSVSVDELMLLEPADGPSALGNVRAALGKPTGLGPWLETKADASLDDGAGIAASAEAGWNADFLKLALEAKPSYSEGEAGIGLGYTLELPKAGSPNRVVDRFYMDRSRGTYARETEVGLSAKGFSISANASSDEYDEDFSQSWKARLSAASIATVAAEAALGASAGPSSGLGPGEAWLGSWSLFAPAAESEADSRSIKAAASLFGSVAEAKAERVFDSSDPASATLSAKIAAPLKFGSVALEPYYWRESSVERASQASSFGDDLHEAAAIASEAAALWGAMPMAELWVDGAFDGFQAFASSASMAAHEAGVGIALRRPMGLGLIDLFVPTGLDISYARSLELDGDSLVEKGAAKAKASGGAANVLSAGGSSPLFRKVSFDEYSGSIELGLARYPSDGAVLPSIAANQALSLEGMAGASFALSSSQSYAAGRASSPWLVSIGAALTAKPARTWFGDLAGLLFGAVTKTADGEAAEGSGAAAGAAEVNWVSAWLLDTLGATPLLKETYAVDASLSRSSSTDAPVSATLSVSYGSSVNAGKGLSLRFGAELSPSLSIYEGSAIWGVGYELSLSAKVIF